MNKPCDVLILLLSILWAPVFATTYYISPSGNDSNVGTKASPFATLQKAYLTAASGDVIFLRGGTYSHFTIAASDAVYNYVHKITKSNISFLASPGETPIFNFSSVSASSSRVCAFLITGSNNIFQGIEITGIQVGSQEQAECFRINSGNGNQFKLLKMHDCPAVGIYIQKTASNTLVENCDAFNLVGVSGSSAGNIDGFGCHSTGTGNVFRGCRAWNCSDDGYDCINAAGAVTFDHCWAYNNGSNGGNGNGFKIGGWGATTPPATVPVHTVTFCLAAENNSHGFYANHQPGQAAKWYNNTSYNQGGDFDMLERVSRTDATDIAGTREVMHNNLAYAGTLTKDLNESGSIVSNNSWTLNVTVSAADFQSVDAAQMTSARQSNGALPNITFMHLASGSDLINKGTNVGLPFTGSAPDLGCFETSATGARVDAGVAEQVAPAAEHELQITVFPNPSSSHFTLRAAGAFDYVIYHADGLAAEKGQGHESINVGDGLQAGLYVISIQNHQGRRLLKVIKK